MSQKVKGNTRGLKPSELKRLEKLYQRRLDMQEIVSLDMAREIFTLASDLRRRIGVLITREGHVEEVCIGTKDILYLPDLGRYRLGRARLRRLRLVFSDLAKGHEGLAHIPHDIYTDLEKLRLDMVVSVKGAGNRMLMSYAHIAPLRAAAGVPVTTENVTDIGRLDLSFNDFMEELEEQLVDVVSRQHVHDRTRALLVGVYDRSESDPTGSMLELEELARTAGVEVADRIVQKRNVDPRTVLGKGKLEEVVLRALRLEAEMLIFDRELKPGQWRAITNQTELKVLDRSMLILDIFASRATSSEGRLQVELAQLKYNLPRLVEKDTGLSRLTGGIGGRGPGETKLEIGRRRIRDRIIELERRTERLSGERQLRRKRQRDGDVPLVAIVGYTNVGKSTLFNALTQSNVLVENKLFATLDPAKRRYFIRTPGADGMRSGFEIVLSDTVGFIRNLPVELRSAFRATLEELGEAKLLLHVLDSSDPAIQSRKDAVDRVVKELTSGQVASVNVLNKVDLISNERKEALEREFSGIAVSAARGEGFSLLNEKISELLLA